MTAPIDRAGPSTATRQRALSALAVLLCLGVGAWFASELRLSTEITHFLPAGEEQALGTLAAALADSELARTLILSVGAPDEAAAARGASALADRLRVHPSIAWVRSGAGQDLGLAVHDLYFPRRFGFLSDAPLQELTERLSERGLRRAARALKDELATPMGSMVRRMASEDPLLSFLGVLRRLRSAQLGGLRMVDGQFVSADGRHGIVFAGTYASPFQNDVQAPLLADIDGAFAQVQAADVAPLSLDMSGIHRFAVASERGIRSDIVRISVLSTVGIVALFFVLYRSLRYILLTAVPVLVGVAAAITVCALLFEQIHGLTLAFGCSLIGVCVDYPIHLINHHALAGSGADGVTSLRRVWPGLVLGCLTTVAGLAGLAWTQFPGIREMAVFATAGVLAALGATRWLLPAWLPVGPKPVPIQVRIARLLGSGLGRLRRGPLVLLWVGLSALALVGGLRLRWTDDLRALSGPAPELLDEDLRVRASVSQMETGRFVVVWGDSEQEALDRNDRAFRVMEAARRAGEIGAFRSVHSLLWSARLQRENIEGLRADPELGTRLAAAFTDEGFAPGAFAPFAASLAAASEPLHYADLLESPLADLVRPFRLELDSRVAWLTFVRDVSQADALAARLASVEGAFYFDQLEFLAKAYGRYRTRSVELLAVGLLLVLALVWARYRRVRLTLAAFVPALWAALLTLGFVGLCGVDANLMHVIGLLLVLSIGVDYGVFLAEHHDTRALPATLLSLVAACLTTVLSFGLLGLSSHVALQSLGVTVGVGVVLALCLSPAAFVLFGARRDRP